MRRAISVATDWILFAFFFVAGVWMIVGSVGLALWIPSGGRDVAGLILLSPPLGAVFLFIALHAYVSAARGSS